ncbi:MAG TPA: glycoside hydrolase family 5 protein [Armatimonadota bacterium]|nr:glycoside hydrolase family 5 protein [Armatimonadota bacterium]
MSHLLRFLPILALAALAAALGPRPATSADDDASAINRMLGRGINFGNALEAPREGEWGVTLKEEYFDAVRKAGFNSVRIPIKWSGHAAREAPYTIDPAFFRRIDWAVDQALARGLLPVINVHHYDELYPDPDAHQARFLALWRQIAEHYRARPDRLVFEALNEPNGKLDNDRWNRMIPEVLAAIRQTNPRRAVIVGPSNWNGIRDLPRLRLPEDDRHLIATFHYYLPFHFTHQGAEWAKGSEKWLGTTWTATPEQLRVLREDFDVASRWAAEQRRPLYLGEFGAYQRADMPSRARWTSAVAREAEKRGFSWAYWEFGAGFGAYDRSAGTWKEPLRAALLQ